MDLNVFRSLVDCAAPGIDVCENDLGKLYDYVGLPQGSAYQTSEVMTELRKQIAASFSKGQAEVWQVCDRLRRHLIWDHLTTGTPLEPYFEVLAQLRDAARFERPERGALQGDWPQAVQAAYDHSRLFSLGTAVNPLLPYANDVAVVEAGRALKAAGFEVIADVNGLGLSQAGITAVVAVIEDQIRRLGGLNVLRQVFAEIDPLYDLVQERYHLVRRVTTTGGGSPQMPWGYIVQLAVKHCVGQKPYAAMSSGWPRLKAMVQAFGAVSDLQDYTHSLFRSMNAHDLVPYLQKMALYDTMFRLPQLRPSDIGKIARGMFDWLDLGAPTAAGWSINQVLEVVTLIFNRRDTRGPFFIEEAVVHRACPNIPLDVVSTILADVLSHPVSGANLQFSLPTDAPTRGNPATKDLGQTFAQHPLLRHSHRTYLVVDRSLCAGACLEALLIALRPQTKQLDDKVGCSIERFLAAELKQHGLSVMSGDYDDLEQQHGQCDLVIDLPDRVVFGEVKKKALTRPSQAGNDAILLLDFAESMVAAQAQAGWHEVRLRRDSYLDLDDGSAITRVERRGREVERIAVSLFDFGSFQDRILLKHFFEAAIYAKFSATDTEINRKMECLNNNLGAIREQVATLHSELKTPVPVFMNCWFLSIPQLLVLLDGVQDPDGFWNSLKMIRNISFGSSDLYYERTLMLRAKAAAATLES